MDRTREQVAESIIKYAELNKLQLHPGRDPYEWVDLVRKKGGKLLVSLTACVGPALVLHVAYYCFMRVAVGFYVYSLPAYSTVVPDLVVLYGLIVTFTPRFVDIGHFDLQET